MKRFTRLDAFTKTVEDARVRTTSGGIVTISSLLIILYLLLVEWNDYRRVVVKPELIVDKGRGEKMEIHMNITFPRVPCELLTLDVMDVSGEVQTGVVHGVKKLRLAPENEGGAVIETKIMDLCVPLPFHQFALTMSASDECYTPIPSIWDSILEAEPSDSIAEDAKCAPCPRLFPELTINRQAEDAAHLDPNYCGECYGAPAPESAMKKGCCNTCDEVRDAYASISWSFGRGEGVEQCQREHYAENLDSQRDEGCRVEGSIRVNKVVGNFHFAPGKSFSNGNMHVHDLDNYNKEDVSHSFSHKIHQLRFGPTLPQDKLRALTASSSGVWSNHHINPLDNTEQFTDDKAFNYQYFIKVVSTAYLPLGWEKKKGESVDTGAHNLPHELVGLGKYGYGEFGSIETHQYSVTSHKRSVSGGSDAAEGHKERLHARGGIPGVFFSYVSPSHQITSRQKRDACMLMLNLRTSRP